MKLTKQTLITLEWIQNNKSYTQQYKTFDGAQRRVQHLVGHQPKKGPKNCVIGRDCVLFVKGARHSDLWIDWF